MPEYVMASRTTVFKHIENTLNEGGAESQANHGRQASSELQASSHK